MAFTLWLVSGIRLRVTLRHGFRLDVLLQFSRSISAAIDPLDDVLFLLTLDSRSNAPSEIVPTQKLRNDLHETCAKISSKLFRFGMFVFLGLPKIQCVCITLCCGVLHHSLLFPPPPKKKQFPENNRLNNL